MTKDYFIQLAAYNVWANGLYCSMLEQITDEQWKQEVVSSFNSIQQTTLHIISAEKVWLQRFEKQQAEWLQSVYNGTKEEHIDLWKKTSADLKSFIADVDKSKLQVSLAYKRLNGEEKSTPFYIMLAHVFNHSTYHRGQLVTMLRQVGFNNITSTDLVGLYSSKH